MTCFINKSLVDAAIHTNSSLRLLQPAQTSTHAPVFKSAALTLQQKSLQYAAAALQFLCSLPLLLLAPCQSCYILVTHAAAHLPCVTTAARVIAVLNTTLNTRKNYTTVYLQHHLHIGKPCHIHCTYNLMQLHSIRYAPHRVRAYEPATCVERAT